MKQSQIEKAIAALEAEHAVVVRCTDLVRAIDEDAAKMLTMEADNVVRCIRILDKKQQPTGAAPKVTRTRRRKAEASL